MTDTNKWYLAQLKPNSHAIALRNLARQGFEAFLPMHDTTVRTRGRFVSRSKPLFPGYIFVSLDVNGGSWRSVNATQGITKIVSFGNKPAEIPLQFVQELKCRCDDEGRFNQDEKLKEGDEVVVTYGPFADVVGRILSISEDQRVWLLLDLLGQKSKLAVDRSALQAV